MIIRNEDVRELIAEIPENHRHLRVSLILKDGSTVSFLEATIANLVRAYITVKTHPVIRRVHLKAVQLDERKIDYDEWQLLEVEERAPGFGPRKTGGPPEPGK